MYDSDASLKLCDLPTTEADLDIITVREESRFGGGCDIQEGNNSMLTNKRINSACIVQFEQLHYYLLYCCKVKNRSLILEGNHIAFTLP